jgi:VanZ family protein
VQSIRHSLREWPGRTVPAIVYAGIVFAASVVNPPSGGQPAVGPLGLVGADKWVHAIAYAVLTVLLAYALWATTFRLLVVVAVVASVYGLGIELVQSALPFRTFDRLDAAANTLGVLVAGLVLWVVSWCLDESSGRWVARESR